LILWNDRNPKLKPPRDFGYDRATDAPGNWAACDRWYSYLINEWIPGQPDWKELMGLFIGEALFEPLKFVQLLKEVKNETREQV
jgi:hypothetical protein